MSDFVNMVDPEGNVHAVPPDEVSNAIAVGFRRESSQQATDRIAGEVKEDIYGNAGGKIAAATAGALRSATFGLSDAALAAAGGADDLRALREVNPGASAVGEVAGALVAPGGAGAPGEAAMLTRAAWLFQA